MGSIMVTIGEAPLAHRVVTQGDPVRGRVGAKRDSFLDPDPIRPLIRADPDSKLDSTLETSSQQQWRPAWEPYGLALVRVRTYRGIRGLALRISPFV